jgi:hypothetical protein
MGQYVNKYRGLNQIGHGGSDGGYKARIIRFPEHKFSVIVLSNNAHFNTSAISQKVVDIYLADKLYPEEVKPINSAEQWSDTTVNWDTLNAYVGDFELGPGVIMNIALENGELTAQVTGQNKSILKPLSTYKFQALDADAIISFHRISSKEVNMAKLYFGGQVYNAPRMEPFDPESIDLSEFEGQYYSDELITKYEFVVKDGVLIAKHQRNNDIKLCPFRKDGFSGDVWFFWQIDFIRDEVEKVNGCKVSGDRAKNVHFRKL